MSNEDRPKRSWREIDKMRDGSGGGRSPAPSERTGHHAERQQKQYRAALEALFEKGQIGKLADKLVDRLGGPASARADNLLDELTSAPEAAAEEAPAVAEEAGTSQAAAADAAAPAAPAAAGKKRPDDKLVLRRKVVEAVGRHDITRAVDKYLERHGVPDDHEFLEQMLEHEQQGRVGEAMDRIAKMLDVRMMPKRSRALCSKLRYLSETSAHAELADKARELLRRLA